MRPEHSASRDCHAFQPGIWHSLWHSVLLFLYSFLELWHLPRVEFECDIVGRRFNWDRPYATATSSSPLLIVDRGRSALSLVVLGERPFSRMVLHRGNTAFTASLTIFTSFSTIRLVDVALR